MNTGNNIRDTGTDWQGIAAKLFCLICALAAIYFAGKYVLRLALPFLFAWLVASAAVPPAARAAKKLHIPERICISVAVLLILALIFILTALAVNRAVYEIGALLVRLGETSPDEVSGMISNAAEFITDAGERIPLLRHLRESEELAGFFDGLDTALGSAIGNMLTKLTAEIPALAASVIKAFPSILLSLAVAVISGFYFALDRRRILAALAGMAPHGVRRHLPELRRRAGRTAVGYVKAYLIILAITFCELFIGFSILRIGYAFLLAAVIAVIAILPVLGVGTVLLPWTAIEFIKGDIRLGIGLLILFGVIEAVRQFIEPRIVGGTLGIHPLVTLAAMYLGFSVFGVAGMFIGPLLALGGRAAAAAWRTESLRSSSA